MQNYYLVIDQGTSSARTLLYDKSGQVVKALSLPVELIYPRDGWVELDAQMLWEAQEQTISDILVDYPADTIISAGITNQRETVVAWSKASGLPLTNAILWQCRRTADFCRTLKQSGREKLIKARTGLPVDPYFSASKMSWLLENSPAVAEAAATDDLVFGTIDSWLIYKLTGNLLTDATNASRTMLMDLESCSWDSEMLRLFNVSQSALCKIIDSDGDYGPMLKTNVRIRAVLGDQQASLYGHCCFAPGETKCTFGTGAFLMQNTGGRIVKSDSGLISTLASRKSGVSAYALEGSIFSAGSLIDWLTDQLKLVADVEQIEKLARRAKTGSGVVLIPAFTGLGAPHWNAEVRAAVLGISSDTGQAEICLAALEAVALQLFDILSLPEFSEVNSIFVDGGMSANLLFNQLVSNICQKEIVVSRTSEVTALGIFNLLSDNRLNLAAMKTKHQRLNPQVDSLTSTTLKIKNWRKFIKLLLTEVS